MWVGDGTWEVGGGEAGGALGRAISSARSRPRPRTAVVIAPDSAPTVRAPYPYQSRLLSITKHNKQLFTLLRSFPYYVSLRGLHDLKRL